MKNKRILSLVLAFAMLLGTFSFAFAGEVIVPTEEDYKEANVSDIKGNEYETAFAKLMAVGVAQGKGEKGADLDANLTRAEAAKMVLHMLGLQEGIVNYGPSGNKFKDVTNKHWASQYIAVAADHGVVTGHTDGTFRPEDPVTEDQIVAMIVRALDWGPIVGGNYPYGEYAKALELKIIEKAPIYNKVATRGYAFQVAANSLKAQMAERKATEDRLTYEGEGYRNLLNDRLHVYNTSEPVAVVKTARMERDFAAGEFEVLAGRNTIRFVGEGFDATEILGDFVEVWYKYNTRTRENEIIYLEKDEAFNKVSGIVEEVKDNNIKLENGRTYNLKDVITYVDNKEGTPIPGDFATITLGKDNKAVFVDAFDITVDNSSRTLDLVSKIVKAEDDRFEFENQHGLRRNISDEKLIVYKNGKLAEVKDIEELDLVKSVPMAGQARTTFVLVVGEKETGKLEEVGFDTRRSDDKKVLVKIGEDKKELLVDHENFMVLDDEYKAAKELDDLYDVYDELRGHTGKDAEEVTLITVGGKAKVLVAKATPKTISSGLVLHAGLEYQTFKAKDVAALNLLNQEGKEEKFTFEDKNYQTTQKEIRPLNEIRKDHLSDKTDQSSGLDQYEFVKYEQNKVTLFFGSKLDRNGKLVEDNYHTIKLGKNITENEDFKGLNKYVLTTSADKYAVTDSTVFYQPKYNDDGDIVGYEVKHYKDIVGKTANDVEMRVFKDPADKDKAYVTPTADVVVITNGSFATEPEYFYGIVTYVGHTADKVYADVYNGEKDVTYTIAKGTFVPERQQAIQFVFTGEDSIKVTAVGGYGVLVPKGATKGSEYEIREIKNDTLESAKIYRVSSDGLISLNDRLYESEKGSYVYFLEDGYGRLRVLNYMKIYDNKYGKLYEDDKKDVRAYGELLEAVTVGDTTGKTLKLQVGEEIEVYNLTADTLVLDADNKIVDDEKIVPAGTKVNLTLVEGSKTVGAIKLVDKKLADLKTQDELDQAAVDAAATALNLTVTDADQATATITLPATGDNDVTIAWSDGTTSYTGTYTTPTRTDDEQSITLTATLTKGSATATKAFKVTIPAGTDSANYGAITVEVAE